jgi:Protein of unknown function (DUF1275)
VTVRAPPGSRPRLRGRRRTSRLLRLLPRLHTSLSVLLLEMLVLLVAGLLPPSFPELAFTALIAFVSAFQVATFWQVGRFSYNSTFITGNLRDCADGFVGHFLDPNPELHHHELAKARNLASLCICFLMGALVDTWGGPHLYNRTLGWRSRYCSSPSCAPTGSTPLSNSTEPPYKVAISLKVEWIGTNQAIVVITTP